MILNIYHFTTYTSIRAKTLFSRWAIRISLQPQCPRGGYVDRTDRYYYNHEPVVSHCRAKESQRSQFWATMDQSVRKASISSLHLCEVALGTQHNTEHIRHTADMPIPLQPTCLLYDVRDLRFGAQYAVVYAVCEFWLLGYCAPWLAGKPILSSQRHSLKQSNRNKYQPATCKWAGFIYLREELDNTFTI